jgi:hypothetical protein
MSERPTVLPKTAVRKRPVQQELYNMLFKLMFTKISTARFGSIAVLAIIVTSIAASFTHPTLAQATISNGPPATNGPRPSLPVTGKPTHVVGNTSSANTNSTANTSSTTNTSSTISNGPPTVFIYHHANGPRSSLPANGPRSSLPANGAAANGPRSSLPANGPKSSLHTNGFIR